MTSKNRQVEENKEMRIPSGRKKRVSTESFKSDKIDLGCYRKELFKILDVETFEITLQGPDDWKRFISDARLPWYGKCNNCNKWYSWSDTSASNLSVSETAKSILNDSSLVPFSSKKRIQSFFEKFKRGVALKGPIRTIYAEDLGERLIADGCHRATALEMLVQSGVDCDDAVNGTTILEAETPEWILCLEDFWKIYLETVTDNLG